MIGWCTKSYSKQDFTNSMSARLEAYYSLQVIEDSPIFGYSTDHAYEVKKQLIIVNLKYRF